MRLLVFSTADPSDLGRLDHASLSQQTLMEIVLSGIHTNKESICGSNSSPKDLSEWQNTILNGNGDVDEIRWTNVEGTFQLEWLPSTVRRIYIRETKAPGTIDASKLPAQLSYLHLVANLFCGEFDLTHLPQNMDSLIINCEKFDGPIDVTKLPQRMTTLHINQTQLSGTVDLTALPGCLEVLVLARTALYGAVDLTQLPRSMSCFNISHNEFSGETDFSKLPQSLQQFSIEYTKLSGRILWDHYTRIHETEGSNVRVFIKLNGALQHLPGMTLFDDGNSDTPFYISRFVVEGHFIQPY